MHFVDSLRRWSMRFGTVVLAALASRLLGVCLGWPFGEGGGLTLASALLLFEQAGQALDLGFQLGDAALQRLATGTSELVHVDRIAKSLACSCASDKVTASRLADALTKYSLTGNRSRRCSSIIWAFTRNLHGATTMEKTIVLLAAVAVCVVCCTAHALYEVCDTGTWPKSWPAELEPLRKQSRTLVGPRAPQEHYAIRFTKREEFESAWPHLLKVKSKGASVRLVRGPNFFLGEDSKAGVVVHCPPRGQADDPTYIELVVDGNIVDLNRIPLPADTPILDERFKDEKK